VSISNPLPATAALLTLFAVLVCGPNAGALPFGHSAARRSPEDFHWQKLGSTGIGGDA